MPQPPRDTSRSTSRTEHERVFYFDLASPYAYLSSTRVDEQLGSGVRWRPVLVGALHQHYRRLTWASTPDLFHAGRAELQARAEKYGLPPIVWPERNPPNSLTAMRAAVWADQQGRGRAFAEAGYHRAFVEGVDLAERVAVLDTAGRIGLDRGALDRALDSQELKDALRAATDLAIAEGVYGVPTFDAGGLLWWGDDLLEAAATRAHAERLA